MTLKFACIWMLLAAMLFAPACGSDDDDGAGTDGDSDGDSDGDTDGDSDGDTDGDSDGDTDGDSDGDTDGDSDGDSDPAHALTDTHPGWNNPGCWNKCHSNNPPSHAAGLNPDLCVACHGTNGAPIPPSIPAHSSPKSCACHDGDLAAAKHLPEAQFKDQSDCTTCHPI